MAKIIDIEFPFVEVKGRRFWQVACRKCQEANSYSIFADGRDGLVIRCRCGRQNEWGKVDFQSQPDFIFRS